MAKLVTNVKDDFMDLDSPKDDPIIVVEESEVDDEVDKDEGIHSTSNVETEDTSASKPPSYRSIQLQELTNQVLILQSQKHKLEHEKNKAKTKVALLTAQPSFRNVEQLNELLVKSLHTEFSKTLFAHDFSSSLPTELKELPTKRFERDSPKLEDFTKTVISLTSQVAELKTLQWELPAKFLSVLTQIETVQAKLKTLDALPSFLNKVTKALNQFAQNIASTSKRTEDASVPSASQAST
ncbi:hypothetical protein Tco_0438506 [Tanacetum coccineum]